MTTFYPHRASQASWRRALTAGGAMMLALAASTTWGHGGGFHGGGGGRGGFSGGGMSRGGGASFSGGRPSAMPSRGPSMSPSRGGAGSSRPGGSGGHFAGDPFAHGGLSADHLRSLGRGTGSTKLKGQSIQTLEGRGNQIRNNFYGGGWYGGRGWYNDHFNAWWPGGWYGGWGGWGVGLATGLLWADLASWGGYGSAPISYDYGTTVVYSDDSVAVGGEEVGTPEEYAQQATDIASSGESDDAVSNDDQWRPLGVYALARDGETKPSTFISLAVDASGVLRGNYYDAISDSTMQITGKVDQKTQRAAWTIGDKNSSVYEAGLTNLLADQTQVLVHRNNADGSPTGNVDQMLLVRVDDGDDQTVGKGQATKANSAS